MRNTTEKPTIQVKPTNNGTTECFSFEVPKGSLHVNHLIKFLEFREKHEPAQVQKSFIHVFFQAYHDKFFDINEEQKMHVEDVMMLLAEWSCCYNK
ncbi:hypothetical protein ACFSJU_14705 [Paradesertivirga mongoliensis]|uniref:Uncharacterized protein n=1 Tax=Paradesertivirga mongoliensis TaxID=2100740 RepID=A0ABW4ZQA6_9SPHI|nr:hypothetical protein [Pedobacter mongoliensis]